MIRLSRASPGAEGTDIVDLPKNHFLAMFEAQGSKFSRTMGAEDCTHLLKLGPKDLVACYDETTGRYQGAARPFSEVVNEMMLMNEDDAPDDLGHGLGLSLKFEGGGLKSARKVGETLYYVFPDDAALQRYCSADFKGAKLVWLLTLNATAEAVKDRISPRGMSLITTKGRQVNEQLVPLAVFSEGIDA